MPRGVRRPKLRPHKDEPEAGSFILGGRSREQHRLTILASSSVTGAGVAVAVAAADDDDGTFSVDASPKALSTLLAARMSSLSTAGRAGGTREQTRHKKKREQQPHQQRTTETFARANTITTPTKTRLSFRTQTSLGERHSLMDRGDHHRWTKFYGKWVARSVQAQHIRTRTRLGPRDGSLISIFSALPWCVGGLVEQPRASC